MSASDPANAVADPTPTRPSYFLEPEVDRSMQLAVICGRWNSERLIGLAIGGETSVHVAETALNLTHEVSALHGQPPVGSTASSAA